MISLSSTAAMVAAMHRARDVSLSAYTLRDGSVLDALLSAARHGARVRVRLEGYIYKDDGNVAFANASAVDRLSKAGADAKLVHPAADAPDAMLHLKGAVVDGTLFLDDRNWPDDGGDTVLRDSFRGDAAMVRDAVAGKGDASTTYFAVRKRDALESEARLLDEARRGDDVIVESESFGRGNRVFAAIDGAAKRGAKVRLLVSSRDLQNDSHERAALAKLEKDGVRTKACDSDEKFAVVAGVRGWIGSANATAAFARPDQFDWGVRTDNRAILTHLRDAFAARWGLQMK